MRAADVTDAFQMLSEFLRADEHYLASSEAYGDIGLKVIFTFCLGLRDVGTFQEQIFILDPLASGAQVPLKKLPAHASFRTLWHCFQLI